MAKMRLSLTILLFILILAGGRESQAVIYKYVTDKGVPTFADDMQKIPEQHRASAVMVSGEVYDAKAEEERVRLAAEALARTEQNLDPVKSEGPISSRLIRSGVAVCIFLALLFVASHIDALREQAQVLFRIRTALVVLLVTFLAFTHAKDVIGLFGKIGDTVTNPVASLQEKSAKRGKKAAEAYKAMERVLDERAQSGEARQQEIERKFDDAERGK